VGTTNVGSRAPAYPSFIVVLRERGPIAIHGRRTRSGRGSDWFPNPEITFLTWTTTISIKIVLTETKVEGNQILQFFT
jgi:hypothetical protein